MTSERAGRPVPKEIADAIRTLVLESRARGLAVIVGSNEAARLIERFRDCGMTLEELAEAIAVECARRPGAGAPEE